MNIRINIRIYTYVHKNACVYADVRVCVGNGRLVRHARLYVYVRIYIRMYVQTLSMLYSVTTVLGILTLQSLVYMKCIVIHTYVHT